MRLHNDVIQESQLVYRDHTEHLNINKVCEYVSLEISPLLKMKKKKSKIDKNIFIIMKKGFYFFY